MRVTVELSWGPSIEADVAGYKVYWDEYGVRSKAVTVWKDVTTLRLSVLLKSKIVYTFAVSSYDRAGNESERRTIKAVYIE